MPKGVARQSFRQGGAERYEVVIDLSEAPAGTTRIELLDSSNPDDDFTSRVMSRQPTGRERVVSLCVQRTLDEWSITRQDLEGRGRLGLHGGRREPRAGRDPDPGDRERVRRLVPPLHIHLVDVEIIGRTGGSGRVLPQEAGPKDVVDVGEGEKVRLLCTFSSPSDRVGRYRAHFHNLPHEDHDMMHQFPVGPVRDLDPYDPVTTTPPVPDPTHVA